MRTVQILHLITSVLHKIKIEKNGETAPNQSKYPFNKIVFHKHRINFFNNE